MNKILVLWGVPRSTSTAFEWMMRQRGDMTCFHEPFGEPWYQGESPLWPRVDEKSLRTPGLTLDSVWQKLQMAASKGSVFTKDFPHYIDHMWTADFLSNFNHSFLIRDPAKAISSMYRQWPDFHLKETAFIEQRQLFDLLCEQLGAIPPVIDSDDLLANPEGIVEQWCGAVGIPFIADALHWAPGSRDEVSWWDGGSFHQNLRNSDGLKPQARRHIDINHAPQRVKEIHDIVLPHYQQLYQHRLSA